MEISRGRNGRPDKKRKKTMKINGKEITAEKFAFDGCHKIYLVENATDESEAVKCGYALLHVSDLKETFENSCELRFIRFWDLDRAPVVGQFEKAVFE